TAQLRERLRFEIGAPRILGREVDLHVQRLVNPLERLLVRLGQRVDAGFREIPALPRERDTEEERGGYRTDKRRPPNAAPIGAPICIHTAAIARPANVSTSDASVTSSRTSPC